MTLHSDRAIENAVLLTYVGNRAYAQVLGDTSFKPYAEAEAWQLDSNRAGITKLLKEPSITPEQSHASWMEAKRADGWTVGHVKDSKAKTHPCMVPYDNLPVQQRTKDHLFLATARQALLTYGHRFAWWGPRTLEEVELKFECTNRDFDLGMLVIHGRANRIVAGALGGLYAGFGRMLLTPSEMINAELNAQVACAMMCGTPELAYDAYRANKWPVDLPDLAPGKDLQRAHWWVMHALARAVMEIEGVVLKPPADRIRVSTWIGEP